MAHANLLLPEATINDAAAQVVYPLPLNDVIKDELLAYGRLELTWRQNKRILVKKETLQFKLTQGNCLVFNISLSSTS